MLKPYVLRMAQPLQLDPATEQAMEELVLAGSFATREQLVREAVRLIRRKESFDQDVDEPGVDEDTREAVEHAIRAANTGRVRSVADVFADLRRRVPRQK